MKKVLWIVAGLLVLLFGWRIFQHFTQDQEGNGRRGKDGAPIAVEVTAITVGPIRETGEFNGSIKPRAGYTLAAKVAGRLERLIPRIGDKVSKGQLLAVLDNDLYRQELEQARAELAVSSSQVEQSRLSLKVAERNRNAAKRLFESGFSSQGEYDSAEADYAAAAAALTTTQARVQQDAAKVKAAEIRLSYTEIRAEWTDGPPTRLVGEVFVDEGAMISANSPILTIVDNSTVIVEIDVVEQDYTRLKPGQAVEVRTDSHPGRVFPGVLARIAPVLQKDSRQARAEVEVPNPEGLLRPGMYARAAVVFAQKDAVTRVTGEALVELDGRRGVYLADTLAMKATFVPVTVGIDDGRFFEITDPAITGKVVVLGLDQIEDGSAIVLPKKVNDDAGEGKKR